MICPRCGVHNQAGVSTCTRCGGSLAAVSRPGRGSLPPVLPVTRRAELAQIAREPRFTPPPPPRSVIAASVGPVADRGPANQGQTPSTQTAHNQEAEIYLLASERATGQPAPPEAQDGASGGNRPERQGRMAIGLSGA